MGSHVIRAWSKTQSTIALSCTEAELLGGVKTACEPIGVSSLLQDLGQDVKMRTHMDASAALGIAQRKGVGEKKNNSCVLERCGYNNRISKTRCRLARFQAVSMQQTSSRSTLAIPSWRSTQPLWDSTTGAEEPGQQHSYIQSSPSDENVAR